MFIWTTIVLFANQLEQDEGISTVVWPLCGSANICLFARGGWISEFEQEGETVVLDVKEFIYHRDFH